MSKPLLNFSIKNLIQLILRLWHHLGGRRRGQFIMLLGLMIFTSLAEVISLGAVIPFLGILISPEKFYTYPQFKIFFESYVILNPSELVLFLSASFAILALIAGCCRVILIWFSTRLSFASGADISSKVYEATLYQPYETHINRNSGDVINTIIHRVNGIVFWIILPVIALISSIILIFSITTTLIIIDATVAVTATIFFGLSYLLVSLATRKKILANGASINEEQTYVIKALQEGLGGIRDVLLEGTQDYYSRIYKQADRRLRRAYGGNTFISNCPRPIIESLGIVLIAILALYLSNQSGGISSALPILGALALGAQRILPALQQAYGSWSNIIGGYSALVDIIDLLEEPINKKINNGLPNLPFETSIELKNINFNYFNSEKNIINGLNLTIKKGSRIALVGRTGSGKSTSLDILMGLLKPSSGQLLVDGKLVEGEDLRAFQMKIAHVPQSIYLADCTFAENIAFGIAKDKIDFKNVIEAANKAQISEFIEQNIDGYNGIVGERGIRLSGGQKQRIGIARALYKKTEILVLDEATSALDNSTEKYILNSLNNLNKNITIVIVAHRLSTVKECDLIYEFENGKIIAYGKFDQLIEKSATFRKMAMNTIQNNVNKSY